jgi:hypothetical protein
MSSPLFYRNVNFDSQLRKANRRLYVNFKKWKCGKRISREDIDFDFLFTFETLSLFRSLHSLICDRWEFKRIIKMSGRTKG